MGLYVRLNIQPGQIDPERWEAVWLTSLQLLEHFPGPLAAHVVDKQHHSRHVVTPHIHFQTGTKKEHWKVGGDLGSSRIGESYGLYRHLTHYGRNQGQIEGHKVAADILWLPPKELKNGEVAGLTVWSAKSQGFPYHYAMLAVATLVENSFPGQALVHGDISRIQAEQIVPWAEAVLRRPLRLPVVTEGARLWQRLAQLYAGQPDLAVGRFLALCVERPSPEQAYSSWRVLLQLEDGPNAAVVHRAYQSELAHYTSLRQRGAQELIAALCEADGALDRVLDWVCGWSATDSSSAKQPHRFGPEELLECLCDILVPIPLGEREVLETLTPPKDQLPTVDTVLFQAFSSLMGKPIACNFYVEEETLAAEFAARWPEQASRLRELLQERIAKTRETIDEARELFDEWLASVDGEDDDEADGDEADGDEADEDENAGQFSPATANGKAYQPAGAFIHEEIARQRRKPTGMRKFARLAGEAMRAALATNHDARQELGAISQGELLKQIARASQAQGFALRESAWDRLDEATIEELRLLAIIARMPSPESSYCEARVQLLETPDLWPVLTGNESAD